MPCTMELPWVTPYDNLLSPLSPRGRGTGCQAGSAHGYFSLAATVGDGLLLFPHSHLFLAPKLS